MDSSSTSRILFVRHFKTAFNEEEKVTGQIDVDVIERPKKIDGIERITSGVTVFVSPLKRCIQTIKFIEDIGGFAFSDIIILDELKERRFGEWENKLKSDIRLQYPQHYKDGYYDPLVTPPNGESYSALVDRAKGAISQIEKSMSANKQILICSHNNLMKALVPELLGIVPQKYFTFSNGVVYDIERIKEEAAET